MTKLNLETLSEQDLRRCSVADVVETVIARDPSGFTANLDRDSDAAGASADGRMAAFLSLFGWRPPEELREWTAVELALPLSDGASWWGGGDRSLTIDLPPDPPGEASPEAADYLCGYSDGLLDGLFLLSEGASGDRVLASLLPDMPGITVYALQHETGELGKAQSLKRYLLCSSVSEDEPEDDPSPGAVGEDTWERLHFLADLQAAEGRCPSVDLYHRSRWLRGLLWGRASPKLEKLLSSASTYEDYIQERDRFEVEPYRANYWLVAHTFLGNEEDAADVAQLAQSSPASATRWLGGLVTRFVGGDPGATLGRVEASRFGELAQSVRAFAPRAAIRR